MAVWLVPVALFWPLAALHLGGAPLRYEGAGGARQLVGLLVHFASFLATWGGARALVGVLVGGVLSEVLPALVVVILLPLLARVAFRLVGVRIINTDRPMAESG